MISIGPEAKSRRDLQVKAANTNSSSRECHCLRTVLRIALFPISNLFVGMCGRQYSYCMFEAQIRSELLKWFLYG